jgi:hypothetical protein
MFQVVVQVLSVSHLEAKLSDGIFFSHVMLSKKLHSLVSLKQLHQGALVEMNNNIISAEGMWAC